MASAYPMSMVSDRRTRKRLATRQSISDVASRLFVERGFDHVTVDEIALAADVGRKTVFNHFSRKEDMFFDLDDRGRDDLREAIRTRDVSVGLMETLRMFAHRSVAEGRPYIYFFDGAQKYMATVAASEALKARARAIRDELTDDVASVLAQAVGREPADPVAKLAASILVSTWAVAFIEAHRVFREQQDVEVAKAAFLAIVDRGATGLKMAMEGTPYA